MQHCRHVKYARRIFVSKRYDVEDCSFYDNATVSKTSKYSNRTDRNGTLTFSTDQYVITPPTTQGSFIGISPVEYSSNNNWSFEADVKSSHIYGLLLSLGNNHYISLSMYATNNQVGIYDYGDGNNWIDSLKSVTLSTVNSLLQK